MYCRVLLMTLTAATVLLSLKAGASETRFYPENLRCEYAVNPLAIGQQRPCLSWTFSQPGPLQQSAYRILAATSAAQLRRDVGDLWDSGKVQSDHSQHIRYAGKALSSRQPVFWKVRCWDLQGQASCWSPMATWQMGLLSQADWEARWIAPAEDPNPDTPETHPAPYLRKEFTIAKAIRSARAYICGLGYYELYLNGEKVGDQVLAPAPTNYDRRQLRHLLYDYNDHSSTRLLYNTFDLSGLLQEGENALGVILGNGWYNQRDRREEGWMWYDTPRLLIQIEIEYIDGSGEKILSDEGWKVATGALQHDAIFTGEIYDARLAAPRWNEPHFEDQAWACAQVVRAPTGKLYPQAAPADKVIRRLNAVSSTQTTADSVSFDFGEMISGWASIAVKGAAGARICLRYCEEMGGGYGQEDVYILSGKGLEHYTPRFTWHAFRHVEVIGLTDSVHLEAIHAEEVHTAVETVGDFTCSNPLFNALFEAWKRTLTGNLHGSIISDCPHRERLGYTADGAYLPPAAIFTLDMARVYRKWLYDLADAQDKASGFVPHTAPYGGGGGGPAWGSSLVILPWLYYSYYGDSRPLEAHFDGMERWVAYLGTRTDSRGLVVREEPNAWCLGEWAAPGKVEIPASFVNTCYYYHVADILSKSAAILAKETAQARYEQLASAIKAKINQAFYDAEKKIYWENRQGANVFPLAFGIVPEEDIPVVVERLVESILKNRNHLDTGILATPLMLDVLSKYGRADIAFSIMNQRDYPGYGYLLEKEATTLWEYWDGKLSHSHPMYGSVVRWFFQELAGMKPDPEMPGFKHILLTPRPCGDLQQVRARYKSAYGQIVSAWRIEENTLHLKAEIPPNTTATLYLPTAQKDHAQRTGGSPGSSAVCLGQEGDSTVFRLTPGTHTFRSKEIKRLLKPVHAATPRIFPYDQIFFKPDHATMTIDCATPGTEVFYTLDGAVPDKTATPYRAPITVSENTLIKAIAYKADYLPSFPKTCAVNFVDPHLHGIDYTVYEGAWEERPDLKTLTPVSTGTIHAFDVAAIPKREDHVAIIFKSHLQIDAEGDYRFFSDANDGSVLSIDEKPVVDNAGYFGKPVTSGAIHLKPGRHAIKVLYFENTGSESIDVHIEGPGLQKQAIPPYSLFRQE